MSVLPLFRHRGDRAADALTEVLPRGTATAVLPEVTDRARRALAELVAQVEAEETSAQAAPPTVVEDYRALPAFRDAVYWACAAGLRGLGTRGLPVPPPPDYDLGRFTAPAGDDSIGPEFDAVADRYAAGFYQASRVFHSADTAGFGAVTA